MTGPEEPHLATAKQSDEEIPRRYVPNRDDVKTVKLSVGDLTTALSKYNDFRKYGPGDAYRPQRIVRSRNGWDSNSPAELLPGLKEAIRLIEEHSDDVLAMADVNAFLGWCHHAGPEVDCWVVTKHYRQDHADRGWRPVQVSGHFTEEHATAYADRLNAQEQHGDHFEVTFGRIHVSSVYAEDQVPA